MIHPRQHRKMKRGKYKANPPGKLNPYVFAGSVVFIRIRIIIRGALIRAALLHSIRTKYTPHDSKTKKKIRSNRISIAARNKSIEQIKFLPSAPFHSHNIYHIIQKEKKEYPFASASQQEATQLGKSNSYPLLHSIRTTFTA